MRSTPSSNPPSHNVLNVDYRGAGRVFAGVAADGCGIP